MQLRVQDRTHEYLCYAYLSCGVPLRPAETRWGRAGRRGYLVGQEPRRLVPAPAPDEAQKDNGVHLVCVRTSWFGLTFFSTVLTHPSPYD